MKPTYMGAPGAQGLGLSVSLWRWPGASGGLLGLLWGFGALVSAVALAGGGLPWGRGGSRRNKIDAIIQCRFQRMVRSQETQNFLAQAESHLALGTSTSHVWGCGLYQPLILDAVAV